MAIQILIKANDTDPDIKKGMVVDAREEPCNWGAKEVLPDFVRVRIPDGTAAEAAKYREAWIGTFEYQAIDGTVVMSINPNIVAVLGRTINPEIKLFLADRGLGVISDNGSSITFSTPINYDTTGLFSDLNDIFVEAVAPRAYIIPEANVDIIINAGGYVERSKAYAKSIIVDRRV